MDRHPSNSVAVASTRHTATCNGLRVQEHQYPATMKTEATAAGMTSPYHWNPVASDPQATTDTAVS